MSEELAAAAREAARIWREYPNLRLAIAQRHKALRDVMERLVELTADVRQPATEPHRTNAADELRVAAGNLYDFLDMDGVADLLNPASAAELRRRADAVQEAIRETSSLPPDLPATLASVDDVAKVCEAAGLTALPDDDEWRDDGVHIWARPDRIDGDPFYEVTVDIARPGHYGRVGTVNPHAPSTALWHAIQAARSAS